jgi:hypothetical protein
VDEQFAAGCVQLPFTSVKGVGDVAAYPDQFTLVLFVDPLIRGAWRTGDAKPPATALVTTRPTSTESSENRFKMTPSFETQSIVGPS